MEAVWSYVAFKGYWGGLVAVVFSPVIAFIAIAQQQPGGARKGGLAYTAANSDGGYMGGLEAERHTIEADTVHFMEVVDSTTPKEAVGVSTPISAPSYIVT